MSRCRARNKIRSGEVNVKRERLTQIVLVIVGLINLALIYFLYTDLRHSSWLLEGKNEIERDRTDVSELFYSGRGLSTRGRKETI